MSLSLVDSLEDALTLQSFVADNSVRIEGTTDSDREPEIDAECLAMIAGDRLNTDNRALATVAAAVVLDREPPEWARRQLKVGYDDQDPDQGGDEQKGKVCAECGKYTETPHADYAPSPTTFLCCECFQDWYPSHDSCGELEQDQDPDQGGDQ